MVLAYWGVDKHSMWWVCLVKVGRPGAFVVLVVFEDGVTNGGTALFKTVEALSRGAFILSTSVELKTKGTGGGGAGHEIIDSNTSLPAILTPRHFLAVSAICYDKSDSACTCFSGRCLVHYGTPCLTNITLDN